jgi:hypothetical protein
VLTLLSVFDSLILTIKQRTLKMISPLAIFQAMENHDEICNYEDNLSIEIQTQANKLYDEIMEE